MKNAMKILGFEALYLLLTVIVAGISALIQIIGRTYAGHYSSFIFSGSNYSYNPILYFFGLVIFIGFMLSGYIFFLKKKITGLSEPGFLPRILFPVIAAIFSLLIIAAVVVCEVLVLGINVNMRPEAMFVLTNFGWAILCFGFMIFAEVVAIKSK